MSKLHLAVFRADVSVPVGHPLCGGWIKPAERIIEPLHALGIVLLGQEAPIVLCAVDWCGICNDAHRYWREHLAKAAHTTPERVAVHTVHQHNAPFADVAAQKLVSEQQGLASIMDVPWFEQAVQRTAAELQASLARTSLVTHIGAGQAQVEKVASNRRLIGKDGRITGWRASACKDEKLRAEPEGLIDSWLKALSFWNEDRKLAVLHYYATHPMSYYGDGLVTSDFVGLARDGRAKEDGVPHIYFTGCAGNIAAGKYNDGAKENRFLAHRIYTAMMEAEKQTKRQAVTDCHWRNVAVRLPARSDEPAAELLKKLADPGLSGAVRSRAAMKWSYLQRAESQAVELGCLHLGEGIRVLHLPGEAFIEFQLSAQKLIADGFIATAAYGDGGPWYIPTAKAYPEGGYEPSAAFVDPEAEALLLQLLPRVGMG